MKIISIKTPFKIQKILNRQFETTGGSDCYYIKKLILKQADTSGKTTEYLLREILQNKEYHCVKIVRIWSCSCPYFPAFGLNAERYSVSLRIQSDSVSLRIQSECGKIRTRITPNTGPFYTMYNSEGFRRSTDNFHSSKILLELKFESELKKNKYTTVSRYDLRFLSIKLRIFDLRLICKIKLKLKFLYNISKYSSMLLIWSKIAKIWKVDKNFLIHLQKQPLNVRNFAKFTNKTCTKVSFLIKLLQNTSSGCFCIYVIGTNLAGIGLQNRRSN